MQTLGDKAAKNTRDSLEKIGVLKVDLCGVKLTQN